MNIKPWQINEIHINSLSCLWELSLELILNKRSLQIKLCHTTHFSNHF